VVRSPIDPHAFICKRIVALPGDSVWIDYFHRIVPRGQVWLQGDNKYNSTDSRDFGSLPMGLIIGRVVLRVWPLHRIMRFDREEPMITTVSGDNVPQANMEPFSVVV